MYFTNKTGTEESTTRQEEILQQFQAVAPAIKVRGDQDLTLLGAPIMYEAGDEVFRKKFEDLQRMGQRLGEIDCHDCPFYAIVLPFPRSHTSLEPLLFSNIQIF